ncbi:hypothetical protein I6A94_21435 [Frankia sp. CN4]|nr:hypothetical protein [Frankia nepalensis]MBL7512410.1 hypothetical protein [Frankia nepalensis]
MTLAEAGASALLGHPVDRLADLDVVTLAEAGASALLARARPRLGEVEVVTLAEAGASALREPIPDDPAQDGGL